MTRGEVETIVRDMLGIVLNRPIDRAESPSRETEEGWDSVRHIELLFMLEEEFGFTFSEDEMSDLDSFGEIVEKVVARTADTHQ
uniref:acyl carrier protein n=1 Tax=uncultured Sphingomonas sp. TaxID=158754 RepID=UPI0025CE8BF4|nr:acyl carrier protein [uncultured Sphingomonas sp.]